MDKQSEPSRKKNYSWQFTSFNWLIRGFSIYVGLKLEYFSFLIIQSHNFESVVLLWMMGLSDDTVPNRRAESNELKPFDMTKFSHDITNLTFEICNTLSVCLLRPKHQWLRKIYVFWHYTNCSSWAEHSLPGARILSAFCIVSDCLPSMKGTYLISLGNNFISITIY